MAALNVGTAIFFSFKTHGNSSSDLGVAQSCSSSPFRAKGILQHPGFPNANPQSV
jgi:hypothetical protein